MAQIVIYSADNCPYCRMAKELLTTRGVSFEEIRVDLDDRQREEMIQLTHRRTVPQILINQQSIGGYDDLVALMKSGKLDELLNH